MAVVEVTIIPLGTQSASISHYVAACHKVLANEEELKYQLTPMSTVIEGDLAKILQVIKRCMKCRL